MDDFTASMNRFQVTLTSGVKRKDSVVRRQCRGGKRLIREVLGADTSSYLFFFFRKVSSDVTVMVNADFAELVVVLSAQTATGGAKHVWKRTAQKLVACKGAIPVNLCQGLPWWEELYSMRPTKTFV